MLIEYVPRVQCLAWSNYSEAGAVQLLKDLRTIHAAGVVHDDTMPRNMMLRTGAGRLCVWIDFDRAATCAEDGSATEREQCWMRIEMRYVQGILEDLVGRSPWRPSGSAADNRERLQISKKERFREQRLKSR